MLEHLANLRSAIENTESGYRDFALSGDDAFLQMSRARTSLVIQEQSTLRALTVDNSLQERRLVIISDQAQRIVQRGDAIVQLRRTGGTDPTLDAVRKGQDDPILDDFRSVARDMEDEELGLLHERNANEEQRFRQSKVALILGSILAILIAAVAAWRVPRDHIERKAAEDKLRRLNRLYATVSGINALGVRVRDRDDLFRNSCRIAVD